MGDSPTQHFFDRYPSFYETSTVGTRLADGTPSRRLHHRYDAIIAANRSLFQGSRVLDIASHDGRWSLAALDAGAKFVYGIEGRSHLVANAYRTFAANDVDPKRYTFVTADIFRALDELRNQAFDVVLCLGIFYHITQHCELFESIRQLHPRAVILDTCIVLGHGPIVRYIREPVILDGSAMGAEPEQREAVVGWPNHEMVAFLAEGSKFKLRMIDWKSLGITDWTTCQDYEADLRRTYVLEASP